MVNGVRLGTLKLINPSFHLLIDSRQLQSMFEHNCKSNNRAKTDSTDPEDPCWASRASFNVQRGIIAVAASDLAQLRPPLENRIKTPASASRLYRSGVPWSPVQEMSSIAPLIPQDCVS